MGEINPGSTSYTLTELLHAINILERWTKIANDTAAAFDALGFDVDSSGYVTQIISTD